MHICDGNNGNEVMAKVGHIYAFSGDKILHLCVYTGRTYIMVDVNTGKHVCDLVSYPRFGRPDRWTDVTDEWCLTRQ